MQRETVFEAWAPGNGAWSLWARPVLFWEMLDTCDMPAEQPWQNISINWAPPASENAVLILDLPGEEGVHLGLALAACGYRPVPLYNGCTGPSELIDHGPLLRALRAGAAYLAALRLPAGAPPAFLLDSRRRGLPRALRPHMLDNRWKVFPEDLPSEQLLQRRGVRRVMLIQRGRCDPQDDLARVLRYWQEAAITLEAKDVAEPNPPRLLFVPPIAWYRQWWYGLLSLLGLQRSPRDGFGYIVPEPTHGSP
jgi:hypothetical protein